VSWQGNQPSMGDIAWAAAQRQKGTITNLERRIEDLQRDLDFANQRLDELQSQVEALEER
jgi:polyhydroxyalkanoate synthesis regulator phasin